MTVAYVVAGPERHGVVLHGLRLAQASAGLAASLVRLPSPSLGEPAALTAELLAPHDRVMVQVTDRLFGHAAHDAARLLCSIARNTSLVVCLHDLPHPAEGADRCARRRAAYREIAVSADVVVVASDHERMLLSQCGVADTDTDVVVVPLPLEPAVEAEESVTRVTRADDIGVFGFLYPGKGVEDVIEATARLSRRVGPLRVTNYGPVADGHGQYATDLGALARRHGVEFTITGYLNDSSVMRGLRTTTVPVAAHRHVSASGSIGTWLSAGRRPVVVDGGWAAELATRLPGSLTLTRDLVGSVSAAFDAPASTWLSDVRIGPSWAQAADRHLRLLEGRP